jgi:hypothetical protein
VIDVYGAALQILRGWRILTAGGLAGLLLAVLLLHVSMPRYSVSYRITAAEASTGNLARLGGGLAALAGVSLGQTSSGASPFDLYIEALTSVSTAEALARNATLMRAIFPDHWDASANQWSEPDDLRYWLGRMAQKALGAPQQPWHRPGAAELHRFLEKSIVIIRPGVRDSPITTVMIEHRDPQLARELLGQMDQTADEYVRLKSLERATQYSAYLTERLAQVDNAEVRADLAKVLVEQEKAVMMARSSVTFAAVVVSPIVSSLRPTSPNYLLVAVLGVAAGLFVASVTILVRHSGAD